MTNDAAKRAMRRYAKKTKQFIIRLRRDTDADVIAALQGVPNKTEYIRELIRKDVLKTA